MIYEVINLKEKFPMLKNNAYLRCYVLENFEEYNKDCLRKSVIIIPGGSYHSVSEREADPVAFKFLGENITCFCLKYSVEPNYFPTQLLEALAAVAYVRQNAKRYNLNPNAISICGFSAGGHLAGCVAAFHHKKEYADMLNLKVEDIKVNGAILSYAVLTMLKYTHDYTCNVVTNGREDLKELLSIEKQVTPNFPKSFIWHTKEDGVVPYQNSTQLADALKENNVEYELVLFEKGGHGISIADENVSSWASEEVRKDVSRWIPMCIKFIKEKI